MNNPQNDDIFFMRQAIAEAEKAFSRKEIPIGAVIVSESNGVRRVIARAHNLTETLGDPTAHAEMQAITAATGALGGKYLPDCTLYVTVEPCPMCASACYWAQVGRVVWGADDPKRGFSHVGAGLLHPKTLVMKGVCETECGEIMTRFFQKIRNAK